VEERVEERVEEGVEERVEGVEEQSQYDLNRVLHTLGATVGR
jgi:hypothetical protein